MSNIHTKIKQLRHVLVHFSFILALVACSDAEHYYEEIEAMPEVLPDYELVYETGDSVTIKGRLNPDNGLRITVGGVPADYKVIQRREETESDEINRSMDHVRFAVTEAMGSGQKIISITSGGHTIYAPAIEIISTKGVIDGTLVLEQHATIHSGDILFYCQNGKGDVYIYRNSSKTIERIKKDGSTETVLALTGFSDEYGDYTVGTLYSGGVDGRGEYLYFSALTPDNSADNARNSIYRLVRYRIGGEEAPETLNRSLYYTFRERDRTLETVKPFEGNIREVKLFQINGIYPDSEGNVYMHNTYATLLLTAAGNLSYLVRMGEANWNASGRLQIWNPEWSGFYSPSEIANLLPGVLIPATHGPIAPDDKLMYRITTPSRFAMEADRIAIELYDLGTRSRTYSYTKNSFNGSFGAKKYAVGPFPILTGVRFAGAPDNVTDQTGFLPLPGKKLLLLSYGETYSLMDFNREYADKYANVEMGTADLQLGSQDIDRGLNTDEEGMIYTLSNNGTKILKSRIK
jgi:hypothetical protein